MGTTVRINYKKIEKQITVVFFLAAAATVSFSPAAFAKRTQFDRNLEDIGASVSAAFDPNELRSPHTVYVEALNCRKSTEEYRVKTALIFGENNLDDLFRKSGMKNQCYTGLSEENPSTGKIYRIRDGKAEFLCSGSTVHRQDIVPLDAHCFKDESNGKVQDIVLPTDRLEFRIAVGTPENCQIKSYAVESFNVGTETPVSNVEKDFAVIKLSEPVTEYVPFVLAPPSLVENVKAGREKLLLTGFARHVSTEDASYLSSVSFQGSAPAKGNHFHGARDIIIHDGDTAKGLSGGTMSVIEDESPGIILASGREKKYVRYFVGVHVAGSEKDEDDFNSAAGDFDPIERYNYGVLLNPEMRSMILDMSDESSNIISAEIRSLND